MAMAAGYEDARRRLEAVGQGHVLRFWGELSEPSRRKLVEQVSGLELESVPRWVEEYVRSKPAPAAAGKIEPAPYYPADPKSQARPWDRERYRAAGEALLRA